MHESGASYLLASLTASPLLIVLIQTAISLPGFALALPAGALADMVDRGRMLLAMQLWMFTAAAGLALLTGLGAITPGGCSLSPLR